MAPSYSLEDLSWHSESGLGKYELLHILKADMYKLKREEMEFQHELETIQQNLVSMIGHCGLSISSYHTNFEQIPDTPSTLNSTPGSFTCVSALTDLAEDAHVYFTQEEDVETSFFEDTHIEETYNEKTEDNQCVPIVDSDGETLYRIIEGCEDKNSTTFDKIRNRPIASSTMIHERKNLTSHKRYVKRKQRKVEHPRACSTMIEDLKEETNTANQMSTWTISGSALEDSKRRIYETEEDALVPTLKMLPRTSTKRNLATELECQRVPALGESDTAVNESNLREIRYKIKIPPTVSYKHTKENIGNRHHQRLQVLGQSEYSELSTLGSIGDDSVFEKLEEMSANQKQPNKHVKKTGLLKRQTCHSKLTDSKALARKMKQFSNSFRKHDAQSSGYIQTLIVL